MVIVWLKLGGGVDDAKLINAYTESGLDMHEHTPTPIHLFHQVEDDVHFQCFLLFR